MQSNRRAIALLITVMFVIVISIAIGFGLKQVNLASQEMKTEKFMYQSSIIIEDVLAILKKSPELKSIADSNGSMEMFIFLSQTGFIPLDLSGIEVVLKLSSARSKFNLSALNQNRMSALKAYLNNYMINSEYVDMLFDNMSGIKEDNSYNSAIFDENPYLFRDYVVSAKHLEKINDFYTKEYNDNNLKNIDFNNLFSYGLDVNSSIDLNYATTEVWEMMLGVQKERAEFLSQGAGAYESIEDLNLGPEETIRLGVFNTSFYEPKIYVDIDISESTSSSKISFEYDIQSNKGSNFAYEI